MHAGVENAGVEIVGEEKIMESERFDNLLLNASTVNSQRCQSIR